MEPQGTPDSGAPRGLQEGAITRIIGVFPAVQAIYLFGSVARGEAREQSDVDLAILAEREVDPVLLWETAQEIADAVGREVDLLDLRAVSTVMRMQVISRGERIFSRDTMAAEIFEDFVFSHYALLNEERKAILDEVAERGNTYG